LCAPKYTRLLTSPPGSIRILVLGFPTSFLRALISWIGRTTPFSGIVHEYLEFRHPTRRPRPYGQTENTHFDWSKTTTRSKKTWRPYPLQGDTFNRSTVSPAAAEKQIARDCPRHAFGDDGDDVSTRRPFRRWFPSGCATTTTTRPRALHDHNRRHAAAAAATLRRTPPRPLTRGSIERRRRRGPTEPDRGRTIFPYALPSGDVFFSFQLPARPLVVLVLFFTPFISYADDFSWADERKNKTVFDAFVRTTFVSFWEL